MIKIFFCLRRLPALSPMAFATCWRDTHGPLVRTLAAHLRIQRYVQDYTRSDDRLLPVIQARSPDTEPYDGVAVLWWRSVDDILEVGQTHAGRAASLVLLADERTSIDLPRSPLLFADEHVVAPP